MLEKLSPPQHEAMLDLLVYMAKADGTVEDAERHLVQQYARMADIDTTAPRSNRTLEELLSFFDSAESRVVVLQYLLRLSHSDGYFADAERSAIVEVSAIMGVPMRLLERIEEWVVEGLRWVQRGEELIEEAQGVVRL